VKLGTTPGKCQKKHEKHRYSKRMAQHTHFNSFSVPDFPSVDVHCVHHFLLLLRFSMYVRSWRQYRRIPTDVVIDKMDCSAAFPPINITTSLKSKDSARNNDEHRSPCVMSENARPLNMGILFMPTAIDRMPVTGLFRDMVTAPAMRTPT